MCTVQLFFFFFTRKACNKNICIICAAYLRILEPTEAKQETVEVSLKTDRSFRPLSIHDT